MLYKSSFVNLIIGFLLTGFWLLRITALEDDHIKPVQPSWTIDGNKIKNVHEHWKVRLNSKNVKETQRIREQLQNKIANDEYVVGRINESEIVKQFNDVLGEEFRVAENVVETLGATGDDEVITNTVESVFKSKGSLADERDIDDVFEEYFAESTGDHGDRRERLKMDLIVEDVTFEFGENVLEWKTFKQSVGDKRIMIGREDESVLIVEQTNDNGNWQLLQKIELKQHCICIETFSVWNSTNEMTEGIVLIGTVNEIFWLNVNHMEVIWKWVLSVAAISVQILNVNGMNYLTAVHYRNTHDLYAMTYKFDLYTTTAKYLQTIPLEKPCEHFVFLNVDLDVILAFPQIDSVVVFTCQLQHDDHMNFDRIVRIKSENINSLEGFQVGGNTYLAVTGEQPQILRYHEGIFVQQTLLAQSFGYVDLFVPLPIYNNDRDDLILLVQHKVDLDSHHLTVVEALIWDGEGFESSLFTQCQIGNEVYPYGTACLIDPDRENGIQGTGVFSNGNELTLIVPRVDAPSGLFTFHTAIVPHVTQDQRLELILDYFKEVVANENAIMREAEMFLEEEHEQDVCANGSCSINELTFHGDFDELYVNGERMTEEDYNVDIDDLLKQIDELQMQIAKYSQNCEIDCNITSLLSDIQELQVDNVDVTNLYAEMINGVPIDEINHSGTIIFEGPLTITDKLDADKVSYLRSTEDSVTFNDLTVNGLVQINKINGEPWDELLDNVVLLDRNVDLEEITVNGDVVFQENIDIQILNDHKYPEGFLLSNGPSESIVTGEKLFKNVLTANSVDCEGFINGINPFDLITLNDEQTIHGSTTFQQLEVTESLQINGKVSGEYMDEFLPNPTLVHTKHVKSACYFKELEVLGPIYVEGNLNGVNYRAALSDVLYKNENDVEITSFKTFDDIEFENNIELTSNLINDIRINDFVTKNTEQELSFTDIYGNLMIKNLELSGLFDFINVTELDINTVKKFGEQYINSELIFEDGSQIFAKNIKVTKTLNHVQTDKYYVINDITTNITLDNVEFVEDLQVDTLDLSDDCVTTGSGNLNGVNWKEFESSRLSLTRNDQRIPSGSVIDTMNVTTSLLNVKYINGIDANLFFKVFGDFNNIIHNLESGRLTTDGIGVTGNLELTSVNGRNLKEILENVVWLDEENDLTGSIEFLDNVYVEGDVTVAGELNGRHFDTFVDSLVLRSDVNPVVKGIKKFRQPVVVTNDTRVEFLNNILFNNIARKDEPLHVGENLVVAGDLVVDHLTFGGFLNEYSSELINDQIHQYNEQEDIHYLLHSDVVFENPVQIESLHIHGNLNDIVDLESFLQSIVYKNSSAIIKGQKILANDCEFGNVHVEYFNDFHLGRFLQNVVYLNDSDIIEISGNVLFKHPVTANHIRVEENAHMTNLMGCSLDEWFTNGLRTDYNLTISDPVIFYEGSLDGNSINTMYLNDIDMLDVITLHTVQNLSGNYDFPDVHLKENMVVEGFFNGVNLNLEYDNTVFVYGNQTIEAETTFQQIRVIKDLEALVPLNGKNLNDVALLTEDLHIRSPMSFRNITVDSVYSDDTVSGFDFIDWHRNSMWRCDRDQQNVVSNWTVHTLGVQNSIQGNGIINGMTTDDMVRQFNELDSNTKWLHQLYDSDYRATCLKLERILGSQRQPQILKYFDFAFDVIMKESVTTFLTFEYHNDHFMIVNVGCDSIVFKWDKLDYKFVETFIVETGCLTQMIYVPTQSGVLYLVTTVHSNTDNCNVNGTNIWIFQDDQMKFLNNLGQTGDYIDIHYRKDNPGYIYAINNRSEIAIEINIENGSKESWKLPPYEVDNFQFIPAEAFVGVALTNGRQIFVVNPSGVRRKRFIPAYYPQINARDLYKSCPKEEQVDSRSVYNEHEIDKYAEECNLKELIAPLNREVGNVASADNVNGGEVSPMNEYSPKVRNVLDDVIQGLVDQLEDVTQVHSNQDEDHDLPEEDNESSHHSDDSEENQEQTPQHHNVLEHLNEIHKTMRALSQPARIALNWEKLKRFSKKATAKLYHGFNEIRDIHKAIDRVRGSDHHLYVSQPFNKGLVHESLSASNRHEYQIERPTLHTITEILDILNNGRKHIEFTVHDFPLNDFQGEHPHDDDQDGMKSETSLLEEKYRNIEEEIHDIVTKLVQKRNELSEIEKGISSSSQNFKYIKPNVTTVIDYNESENANVNPESVMASVSAEVSLHNKLSDSNRVESEDVQDELPEESVASVRDVEPSADDASKSLVVTEESVNDTNAEMSVDKIQDRFFTEVVSGESVKDSGPDESVASVKDVQQSPTVTDESVKDTSASVTNVETSVDKIQDRFFTEDSGPDESVASVQDVEQSLTATEESVKDTSASVTNVESASNDNVSDDSTSLRSEENYVWVDGNDSDTPQSVFGDEYLVSESFRMPSRYAGEIIVTEAGPKSLRRKLIIVTELKFDTTSETNDAIRVYFDILDGPLFQTIPAARPRSLVSLQLQDETILAFVEKDFIIKIFSYRGVEGFVEISEIHSDEFVVMLSTTSLNFIEYGYEMCPRNYVTAVVGSRIKFYEAKMTGHCVKTSDLNCSN